MREINMQRNIEFMGNDILISVHNKEGAHIGSCVMAIPYQRDNSTHVTCQTMNQVGHKEETVAKQYAKEVALISEHVVCCVCGIHLDDIEQAEMDYILDWCSCDIERLKMEIIHKYK